MSNPLSLMSNPPSLMFNPLSLMSNPPNLMSSPLSLTSEICCHIFYYFPLRQGLAMEPRLISKTESSCLSFLGVG